MKASGCTMLFARGCKGGLCEQKKKKTVQIEERKKANILKY